PRLLQLVAGDTMAQVGAGPIPRTDTVRAHSDRPGPADMRARADEPLPALPTVPAHGVELEDPVELLLEQVVEDPESSPLHAARGLRCRCAIITGGATGIGRAIALELARHGVHVAFNYFDSEDDGGLAQEAESTTREITQLEVRVYSEEC